jgi:hypothetical protein
MSAQEAQSQGYADGKAGAMGKCLDDPQADAAYQQAYQQGLAEHQAYNGPSVGPDNRTEQERQDDNDAQERAEELKREWGETPPEEIERMHRGGNNPEIEMPEIVGD